MGLQHVRTERGRSGSRRFETGLARGRDDGRRSEARAFWLRAARRRRDPRRSPLPAPGPGEVLVRTLRSGVSRGTETLVFRGGVPAEPVRRDARAVPGGRLPGPVKYGYLNVGVVEEGPPALLGRTVFCLYPHQTAYVVPGRRRAPWCPTACRRRGRCSPAPSRPRSTRCGTPPRCSATGSPSSAPAWSAAASPGCSPGSPACEVTLVDVDPARADVAGRARRRTSPRPDDAARRPRPRRAHQRHLGRAAALARPARAGGHGPRPQLVRRRRGHAVASAARSTPAGWRSGPARSARSRRPGAAPAYAGGPAGARAGPAARPGVRRAAHRRVARSPSCPT